MSHLDMIKLSRQLETLQEWSHWDHIIPYLSIPPEWSIAARPNFFATIIRYNIQEKSTGNSISVYLDCYDTLGIVGHPYWEVFPDMHNDTTRISMENVDELMEVITLSFEHWDDQP